MRRGVVTGSVLQGMALTVPIGGLSFLVMTIAFGKLHELLVFPMAALTWLACQGVVHFVIGRYCNFKSNQLMGVNLTAPIVQLQVPFAMMLAVVMLHEKFTVLQAIGSALMLGGSFITQGITQGNTGKGKRKASAPLAAATPIPTVPSQEELAQEELAQEELAAPVPKPIFQPRVFSGYIFGLGAAMCYGSSPLMARQAFLHAPDISTAAGGCLAYTAATLFFLLILLKPGSWADIKSMKRENLPCRSRIAARCASRAVRSRPRSLSASLSSAPWVGPDAEGPAGASHRHLRTRRSNVQRRYRPFTRPSVK